MDLGVDICSEETEGINTLSDSASSSGHATGESITYRCCLQQKEAPDQACGVKMCSQKSLGDGGGWGMLMAYFHVYLS
jgi:hypothetical protein